MWESILEDDESDIPQISAAVDSFFESYRVELACVAVRFRIGWLNMTCLVSAVLIHAG